MVGQVRQESVMSFFLTRYNVANSVSKKIYCSLETWLSFQPRNSRRSLKKFIRGIRESTDVAIEKDNLCGGQDCQARWSSMSMQICPKCTLENSPAKEPLLPRPLPEFQWENCNRPVPTQKHYLPDHCKLFFWFSEVVTLLTITSKSTILTFKACLVDMAYLKQL